MYVGMQVCMYVCMYEYASMYVCMYEYVYIRMFVCIQLHGTLHSIIVPIIKYTHTHIQYIHT